MAEIIKIDLEEGDFSDFNTQPAGTGYSVNSSSPIEGSYDYQINITGTHTTAGSLSAGSFSTSSGFLKFGFRFNLNTLSVGAGESVIGFLLSNDTGVPFKANILEGPIFRFYSYEDDDTEHTLDSSTLTGTHTMELLITRATNDTAADGAIELFFDGSSVDSASSLDNYDLFQDMATGIFTAIDYGIAGSPSGIFNLDDITLRDDSETIFPAVSSNSMRALGLHNNGGYLYLTGAKNGTLSLYRYDLATLAEDGTPTFSTATDADMDAGTRGIKPKALNESDVVVYGLDGGGTHLALNQTGGTGTYADMGDGTWSATDIIKAYMPAPLNLNDQLVTFREGQVHQSFNGLGTANWSENGTLSTGINYAARHPIYYNEILAGGTAAGTILFSQNRGVSTIDVSPSGGTVTGTDSISKQIAAGADDGRDNGSSYTNAIGGVNIGNLFGAVDAFFRFINVTIPNASTINSAHLTLIASAASSNSAPALIIYGNDIDDAANPADHAAYVALTRTTASVAWAPAKTSLNEEYNTADITTIIQEIVDRGSWASGNAMAIFIEDNGSSSGNYTACWHHDGASAKSAVLNIVYQGSRNIGVLETVAFSL